MNEEGEVCPLWLENQQLSFFPPDWCLHCSSGVWSHNLVTGGGVYLLLQPSFIIPGCDYSTFSPLRSQSVCNLITIPTGTCVYMLARLFFFWATHGGVRRPWSRLSAEDQSEVMNIVHGCSFFSPLKSRVQAWGRRCCPIIRASWAPQQLWGRK